MTRTFRDVVPKDILDMTPNQMHRLIKDIDFLYGSSRSMQRKLKSLTNSLRQIDREYRRFFEDCLGETIDASMGTTEDEFRTSTQVSGVHEGIQPES